MVTRADLSIYRGDTCLWSFRLWEDEARTQPVDLSGVVFASTIKQGGVKTTMACAVTGNQVDVTLSADDSKNLTPTKLLSSETNTWDLQATYSGGIIKTIVAGTVTVVADVTGAI